MTNLKSTTFIILLIFTSCIISQENNFSKEDYEQFIESHQGLSSTELMALHPAGDFHENVHQQTEWSLYWDSVAIKFNLTDYEKSLIQKNGFVVTERLQKSTFAQQLLEIYQKDLPVFISTDAILHAFHDSYDKILKDVEVGYLVDAIREMIINLRSKMPELETKYVDNAQMSESLKDVDLYLTVPLRLLTGAAIPYYDENDAVINEMIGFIESETLRRIPFFGDTERDIDFSQFKPRGHYIDEYYPVLEKYFKTMIWLGRIEIYLLEPEGVFNIPVPDDMRRQSIDAMLLTELFELAFASNDYDRIEEIVAFFVGEQDNVTLSNLFELKAELNIERADQLLVDENYILFKNTLQTKSYALQQIQSQILYDDPFSPDNCKPASAFMLFGQRFVMDSYVTGSVVHDKVELRILPSTLDILFALGNNAAAQLLQPELDEYQYAPQIASLRYLIDSYDENFWNSSIYNMWLNSLRSLNPPENKDDLPRFMKSGAWWQQKMNTQLAS